VGNLMVVRGQVTLAVEHNFETAHRLPFLGGKCENLHGHSWKVKVHLQRTTVVGGMDADGISMEYGSVKKVVRQWIDMYLDHGAMLGHQDVLLDALLADNSKVFVFGPPGEVADVPPDMRYSDKPWPTVEAVAEMICMKLQEQFDNSIFIVATEVRETGTNWVTFTQASKGLTNG